MAICCFYVVIINSNDFEMANHDTKHLNINWVEMKTKNTRRKRRKKNYTNQIDLNGSSDHFTHTKKVFDIDEK